MNFKEIILFQLKSTGKSLGIELRNYIKEIKETLTEYSKQAYSKARMKIKYEGYIELNDAMLKEYYNNEYKTYKLYRLLGEDGSDIHLQHGEEIRKEFGSINKNKDMVNASKSTVVYDLLNHLVIDSKLNRHSVSERECALEQLKKIKEEGKQKKDILVADRGFPSLEMFIELEKMGYDFVIRYSGNNFLRETISLVNSSENDKTIEISLRSGSRREENKAIKAHLRQGYSETIRLRILKIELPKGTTEYLITSLIDKEEFEIEDFKLIYNYRWNEETYFDFQKNVMHIEDFTGKTVESIKQDYYSRILVGNLHSMIVADAQKEVDEEIKNKPKLKYKKYKINKNITFGLMKESIYNLLNEDNNNWQKEYEALVQEAKKFTIAVRENRSYPRKRKGSLKYPLNKKRAF